MEGKVLVHRIFDQAFNQGDVAILDALVAADSITRTVGWGMPARRMGLKHLIASFHLAFPDLHTTVEAEIYQDATFAACWTLRGTHTGAFLGNPPTGKRVVVQGMIFARSENGLIVEDWVLIDQMEILQQLGLIPPAGH